MKILVTGCCGLIGSTVVTYFAEQGHRIVGIDNNMRRVFFGPEGDTTYVRELLISSTPAFSFHDIDIRDEEKIFALFERERFDAVIHCAAQPSHDKARDIPLVDFGVNATGTLNLLEANRRFSAEAPFAFMSTNKVYGDGPNNIDLVEQTTRWDYADPQYANGIAENFSIDACLHSLFGASKAAADLMVQEYGRYFDMPTCCLRGGCLTGPNHSGVELHGFLSYLVKCNMTGSKYTVYGYKGKQVRDNIHSLDVVRFIDLFLKRPKSGAVYNLGGGKDNTVSVLEAFDLVRSITGKTSRWEYSERHRSGDHICYYSDLTHMRNDYPDWDITKPLKPTLEEIVENWDRRFAETSAAQP